MTATSEAALQARRSVDTMVQHDAAAAARARGHAAGQSVGSQPLADRIANGFDEPATILPLFADPAQAAAA